MRSGDCSNENGDCREPGGEGAARPSRPEAARPQPQAQQAQPPLYTPPASRVYKVTYTSCGILMPEQLARACFPSQTVQRASMFGSCGLGKHEVYIWTPATAATMGDNGAADGAAPGSAAAAGRQRLVVRGAQINLVAIKPDALHQLQLQHETVPLVRDGRCLALTGAWDGVDQLGVLEGQRVFVWREGGASPRPRLVLAKQCPLPVDNSQLPPAGPVAPTRFAAPQPPPPPPSVPAPAAMPGGPAEQQQAQELERQAQQWLNAQPQAQQHQRHEHLPEHVQQEQWQERPHPQQQEQGLQQQDRPGDSTGERKQRCGGAASSTCPDLTSAGYTAQVAGGGMIIVPVAAVRRLLPDLYGSLRGHVGGHGQVQLWAADAGGRQLLPHTVAATFVCVSRQTWVMHGVSDVLQALGGPEQLRAVGLWGIGPSGEAGSTLRVMVAPGQEQEQQEEEQGQQEGREGGEQVRGKEACGGMGGAGGGEGWGEQQAEGGGGAGMEWEGEQQREGPYKRPRRQQPRDARQQGAGGSAGAPSSARSMVPPPPPPPPPLTPQQAKQQPYPVQPQPAGPQRPGQPPEPRGQQRRPGADPLAGGGALPMGAAAPQAPPAPRHTAGAAGQPTLPLNLAMWRSAAAGDEASTPAAVGAVAGSRAPQPAGGSGGALVGVRSSPGGQQRQPGGGGCRGDHSTSTRRGSSRDSSSRSSDESGGGCGSDSGEDMDTSGYEAYDSEGHRDWQGGWGWVRAVGRRLWGR